MVYCVNDGKAPAYMNASPEAWKHQTLSECCLANFQFLFRECMGSGSGFGEEGSPLTPCTEPVKMSGKWYVEYYDPELDPVCVQECDGPYPCNGLARSYKEIYETYTDCCDRHLWYVVDSCGEGINPHVRGDPFLAKGLASAGPGLSSNSEVSARPGLSSNSEVELSSISDSEPSNKFYADYSSGSCMKDCEPGPFGCAIVPPPVVLYDTIELCCAMGQSWIDFGYCTSRSVGDYTNGWVVDYSIEKCVKDCNPDDGPPCARTEHSDGSAPIYASVEECCARLDWIDANICASGRK